MLPVLAPRRQYSFWSHAQAVSDEVAHGDLARALEDRRTRLEPHHVGLLKLKLRRVLARDNSFVGFNIVRQAVEQGRLARASAARDLTLQRTRPMILSIFCARRRNRPKPDQLIERKLVLPELVDR